MIIRFTPEADAELTEAREWYSHQRRNLDVEFMQCIDNALSRIVDHGADRNIKDTKVGATAAGWAEHGGHRELRDLL